MAKVIIVLGPPGAGKGTQAEKLVKNFGYVQISTGNILREEVAAKSELGLKAKQFMDAGALVPDDLVINMLKGAVTKLGGKSIILDGFPRTESQAKVIVDTPELKPTNIIQFDVSEEPIIERMAGRRYDPKTGYTYHIKHNPPPAGEIADRCIIRDDDKEATVRKRFVTYKETCEAVENVFGKKNIVHIENLDGSKGIDAVYEEVLKALKQTI